MMSANPIAEGQKIAAREIEPISISISSSLQLPRTAAPLVDFRFVSGGY